MRLACPNGCRDDDLFFTVSVTVDTDGDLAEPLRKIPAEYFKCMKCGADAKDTTNA